MSDAINTGSRGTFSTNKKNRNASQQDVILTTRSMDEIEKRQLEEIKEVFELFDSDKKGYVLGDNLKICLKTLGIDMKKKEILALLTEMFKKNLESPVYFDEFSQIARKKFKERDPDEELEKEFLLLCDYKEGDERDRDSLTITRESLTQLAKNVGELMTAEEIDEMITIVGGEEEIITKSAFIEFMKNPMGYKASMLTTN